MLAMLWLTVALVLSMLYGLSVSCATGGVGTVLILDLSIARTRRGGVHTQSVFAPWIATEPCHLSEGLSSLLPG